MSSKAQKALEEWDGTGAKNRVNVLGKTTKKLAQMTEPQVYKTCFKIESTGEMNPNSFYWSEKQVEAELFVSPCFTI